MSKADEELQIHSGRVVALTEESEGERITESIKELRSHMHELEQKLVTGCQ